MTAADRPLPAEADASGDAPGLRRLFDAIDEGFCICEMVLDDDGEAIDYRFVDTNPLFEEMTGLSDAVGRTALELVPDLESHWIETYARVGLGGEWLRFQQGSEAMGRWFDVSAAPLERPGQFAIVFRDTTAARWAGVTLRESEHRFRALLDELPLVVWVHDASGAKEYVNQRYCEFFGVSREETRDDGWTRPIHPDDRAGYLDAFARAVAERQPFSREVRARARDGRWRRLEVTAAPRFDADGVFVGHLGVATDVTDRTDALLAEREARQRAETLEAVTARLAAARTVDEVVAGLIDGLSDRGLGDISVWIERDQELVAHAPSGRSATLDQRHPTTDTEADEPAANARRTGSVIGFETGAAFDRRHPDLARSRSTAGFESLLALPVTDSAGVVLAVIEASSSEPGWFTAERRSLLSSVVAQVAGALERAVLHGYQEQERRRAELTAHILTELEGVPSIDAQLVAVAELLVPAVADFVTIEAPGQVDPIRALVHHDQERAVVLAALRRRVAAEQTDTASLARVAAGQPQVMSRMTEENRHALIADETGKELLATLGVRSHLAVPLSLGHQQKGALLAGITDPKRARFSKRDLDFFLQIAQRVGSVIESTGWRQREHDASVRLQRALLPRWTVPHPRIDVAAVYEAASEQLEIGGDWYDTFAWPSGAYAVVVGDVVGHGVEAAAAMGRLRSASEAMVAQGPSEPMAIIDALDHCVRSGDGPDFVTASCVVIDPETDTLRYATAGHPPPLLVRGDETLWLDQAVGGPLCSLVEAQRTVAELSLEPDDLIVVFTDGLIERRGIDLADGLDRLVDQASALRTADLGLLNRRLLAGLADGSEDDMVVVTVRYAPTSPALIRAIPPDPSELAGSRRALQQWLAGHGVARSTRDAVLLAANEALSNAIEHSTSPSAGDSIQLRASMAPETGVVTVTVADTGLWRRPALYPVDRGRGTDIMRKVATEFDRTVGPTGTVVTMTFDPGLDPWEGSGSVIVGS